VLGHQLDGIALLLILFELLVLAHPLLVKNVGLNAIQGDQLLFFP